MVAWPERHAWPSGLKNGTRACPGLGGGGVDPSKTTRPVAVAPRPTMMLTASLAPPATLILVLPTS